MSDAKTRAPLGGLLYIVLLAVSIFAAWQIHLYWFADGRRGASQRPGSHGPTTHPAPSGELDLRMLTAEQPAGDWTAAAGLVMMSGDPGGVNPPAGAKRRFAFSRLTGDSNEQLARYEYTGSIDAAAGHYKTVLASTGFEVTTVRPGTDERLLTASRQMERIVVVLRPSKTSHGKVEISVTLIIPHSDAELGDAQ